MNLLLNYLIYLKKKRINFTLNFNFIFLQIYNLDGKIYSACISIFICNEKNKDINKVISSELVEDTTLFYFSIVFKIIIMSIELRYI